MMMRLLLASSSVYRRQLLQQLGIPFDYAAPNIDETQLQDETPQDYVKRLAIAKAQALHQQFPMHWIIGSDQCCVVNGQITGKPLTVERAIAQLSLCNGRSVEFFTGLSLISPEGEVLSLVEPFTVHFRELTLEEITRYVEREKPLDCAGSFKVEGLGIHLFKQLQGRDPNALIGLPLIGLLDLMREAGIKPLG